MDACIFSPSPISNTLLPRSILHWYYLKKSIPNISASLMSASTMSQKYFLPSNWNPTCFHTTPCIVESLSAFLRSTVSSWLPGFNPSFSRKFELMMVTCAAVSITAAVSKPCWHHHANPFGLLPCELPYTGLLRPTPWQPSQLCVLLWSRPTILYMSQILWYPLLCVYLFHRNPLLCVLLCTGHPVLCACQALLYPLLCVYIFHRSLLLCICQVLLSRCSACTSSTEARFSARSFVTDIRSSAHAKSSCTRCSACTSSTEARCSACSFITDIRSSAHAKSSCTRCSACTSSTEAHCSACFPTACSSATRKDTNILRSWFPPSPSPDELQCTMPSSARKSPQINLSVKSTASDDRTLLSTSLIRLFTQTLRLLQRDKYP